MKTARLIARFLQAKARVLQRQRLGECLLSLGIGTATLFFQFVVYSGMLLSFTFFDRSAVEVALTLAGLLIVLQFVVFFLSGDYYRDPISILQASPRRRLLVVGFFLVGPQTMMDAVDSLKKAWRVSSADFDNCASVLYVMMKEPDAITISQARDAISSRQSAHVILDQLRLFPGVIVRPAEVRLMPGLRIEIADFCRTEKERILESTAVNEMGEW